VRRTTPWARSAALLACTPLLLSCSLVGTGDGDGDGTSASTADGGGTVVLVTHDSFSLP
jgi:hypothetical protein